MTMMTPYGVIGWERVNLCRTTDLTLWPRLPQTDPVIDDKDLPACTSQYVSACTQLSLFNQPPGACTYTSALHSDTAYHALPLKLSLLPNKHRCL